MTWTYTPSLLATSKLMQVRYLMGDTIATDQQVQDEEINFAISQRTNTYGAAATVCRALASQKSREADTVDKDLRDSISQRAKAYGRMASDYEMQSTFRSGALPYAGGISQTDRAQQINDTDRVPPDFNKGMTDNFVPVGEAGNEEINADSG